jgi:hypothetical protein
MIVVPILCVGIAFILGIGLGSKLEASNQKRNKLLPPPQLPGQGPYRNAFDIIVDEYDQEEKESKKEKPLAVVNYEELHKSFTCPKCGLTWQDKNIECHKYCECGSYDFGHYHVECSGTRNGRRDCGCFAKWIMKAKDE